MRLNLDTTGVEENKGGFVLIPEDIYSVQIIEVAIKTTSKGDPMASVKFEILEGEYKGKWLFDNIVIPLPGSPSFGIMGRTMHFLHVIGQPYEGKFTTDTDRWQYQKLRVKVKHKKQEQGKYAGQMMATVAEHDFISDAAKEGEIDF